MIKMVWPDGSYLTLDELKEGVGDSVDLRIIREHIEIALKTSSSLLATERGRIINTELAKALQELDEYIEYLSRWEPKPVRRDQAIG